MKEVIAYRCQYCGKVYLKDYACKKHEDKICPRNPDIRPLCYSCEFYHQELDKKEIIAYYVETYMGQDVLTKHFDLNLCKHPDNQFKLYNNIKLSDEMREGLSDAGFVPMPNHLSGGCDFYKPIPNHPYADKNND